MPSFKMTSMFSLLFHLSSREFNQPWLAKGINWQLLPQWHLMLSEGKVQQLCLSHLWETPLLIAKNTCKIGMVMCTWIPQPINLMSSIFKTMKKVWSYKWMEVKWTVSKHHKGHFKDHNQALEINNHRDHEQELHIREAHRD